MFKKMKKICLAACSLIAAASIVSGFCAISKYQVVAEEAPAAPTVTVDTETKSAWESAGYGTDGYIILGSNSNKAKLGYSNLYTKYGIDGRTEFTWYRHGNSEFYYEEYGNGVDDTAPIGKWAWLGQTWSRFTAYSGRNSYLYVPGTTTTEFPGRLHNTNDSPNKDTGFSFELRDVGSINVSVYVTDAQAEWNKVDYTANPITVSLYKTKSLFQTTANDSNKAENITRLVDEYYGEAIAETTVTNNVYVTFALNEPGVYTIVAYNKTSDKNEKSYILPSTTGLFFDKELYPEITSTSLSLEGDIGVNYYVGAHGQDLTGAIMQVEYLSGAFEKVSALSKNADGTYKFQVKVSAKDYAEKMKICFFTEDGTTLSRVFEYSPSDYVATVLGAGEDVYGEKLIDLATALDNYGKAAANLFYDQENSFTADLSAVTKDTLSGYQFSVEGSLPTGVAITDFSLLLKSTTSLKIYFTATSIGSVVCKVDGVTVKPKATGVENEYCIEIENIKAKDLDTNHVVSIGSCTLTLNALSYAYRAMEYSSNADLLVAMQALYLYNQAANAYFEQEA